MSKKSKKSFLAEILGFFVRIDERDYVTVQNINVHVEIRKHFRSNTFLPVYRFFMES